MPNRFITVQRYGRSYRWEIYEDTLLVGWSPSSMNYRYIRREALSASRMFGYPFQENPHVNSEA